MFPASYFGPRYFAPRYWVKVGAIAPVSSAHTYGGYFPAYFNDTPQKKKTKKRVTEAVKVAEQVLDERITNYSFGNTEDIIQKSKDLLVLSKDLELIKNGIEALATRAKNEARIAFLLAQEKEKRQKQIRLSEELLLFEQELLRMRKEEEEDLMVILSFLQ